VATIAYAIIRNKEKKYKIILLVIFLICIWKNAYGDDIFKDEISSRISEFECPIFQGGYNVNISTENPLGTKAFSYALEMEYPAQQIIDFYNNYFKLPEWQAYFEDRYGKGKWFSFIDATDKGNPRVNRFFTTWIDPKKEVRVVLALEYRSTYKENELGVTCQIYPFFDMREVEKQLEKSDAPK
jgi:hypothetical protein